MSDGSEKSKKSREGREGGPAAEGRGDSGRAWVRAEVERIRALPPDHGARARDQLERQVHTAESDPVRHLPGYDVRKTIGLEDKEIRTNPEGYLRRHEGKGLSPAVEHELRQSLIERDAQRGAGSRREERAGVRDTAEHELRQSRIERDRKRGGQ